MWKLFMASTPQRRLDRLRYRSIRPQVETLEERYCPSGASFELSDPEIATLAAFNGANGSAPSGATMDSAGNIYGLYSGGIFEVAKGSGNVTNLASFSGTTVSAPMGNLFIDSAGNLYGTSKLGGASGSGSVFELPHGSNKVTVLASFSLHPTGTRPNAGLIMDSAGNLYGTTWDSSSSPNGEIFEVAKGSGTITVLAQLNWAIGQWPSASLIMDGSGNLFGTATQGGGLNQNGNINGNGSVFELAKGSGTITLLAAFDFTDGGSPQSALLMDSSGNLYGTTTQGGANNDGTVFEVVQGSGTITTLASFNGANGASPQGNLIMDGNGDLYGTTNSGGANNDGTVFGVAQGSGAMWTLATFNGVNGATPGGLLMDSSGNMFGTTSGGGAYNAGTVFEVVPGITFQVSGFPSTAAGVAQQFNVTVHNPDGTTDAGYTGTVHFTSSDPQAGLPADYTFTSADAGVHIFTATLKTAGSESINVIDTVTAPLSGAQTGIAVTPGAATHFSISAPASVKKGTTFNVTVTALDAYGNIATGYLGTVSFTSSDGRAKLPANYSFTASDAGVHVFKVTLNTVGPEWLTIADTKTKSITGTDSGIQVTSTITDELFLESMPSSNYPGEIMHHLEGAPAGVEQAVALVENPGNSVAVEQDEGFALEVPTLFADKEFIDAMSMARAFAALGSRTPAVTDDDFGARTHDALSVASAALALAGSMLFKMDNEQETRWKKSWR